MSDAQRLSFEPTMPDESNAGELFFGFVRELMDLPVSETDKERNAAIETCRRKVIRTKNKCDAVGRQSFVAAVHVLSDLAKQGWSISVKKKLIQITRQEQCVVAGGDGRERVRGHLHAERDEQLQQPAVTTFIKAMEAKQLFNNQFVSIFSLMRDGKELAAQLRKIGK